MTETPQPDSEPNNQVTPPTPPELPIAYPPQVQQPHVTPSFAGGVQGMPTKTNGMAVTSMVLGILSLLTCCLGIILGALAAIFGGVAMKQIKESQGTQTGNGMAVAGLVCGIIGMVLYGGWYILAVVGVGTAPLYEM